MADNVQTPGGSAGDPLIASDEIGGVHYQRIKLVDPVADSASPLAAKSTGAERTLAVAIVDGAGNQITAFGGGAVQTDKSAFVEGAGMIAPVGGVFSDTAGADPTEDQAAAARITAKRALHANLRNAAGSEIGVGGAPLRTDPTGTTAQPVTDNGGSLTVDGSVSLAAAIPAGGNNIGDVDVLTLPALPAGANTIGSIAAITTGVTPGTGAANLGKAEDSPHTSGDVGVMVLGIRSDSATTPVSADGDYHPLTFDGGGFLRVRQQGTSPHDSVASSNPMMISGVAESPDDTAPANQVSAEGDQTSFVVDRDGALYTHPHPPRIWHATSEFTTAQTDTTVKAAPGAGLSLYVTDIFVAANGAVTVTLEEGTSTLKFRFYAASAGQSVSRDLTVPIKLTANTALTVTTSAAVTCTVSVCGYTAP
ncbi:MAG: hypothetical protein ACKVP5_17310 [Aestuariivirga sp.]